jgi:Tol biopolymer transport system component
VRADYEASCPAIIGPSPVMTADGGTVVFATAATLGIAPADVGAGCHVFAYDVASHTTRLLLSLPADAQKFDLPAISDDGGWLSFFVTCRLLPDGGLTGWRWHPTAARHSGRCE